MSKFPILNKLIQAYNKKMIGLKNLRHNDPDKFLTIMNNFYQLIDKDNKGYVIKTDFDNLDWMKEEFSNIIFRDRDQLSQEEFIATFYVIYSY